MYDVFPLMITVTLSTVFVLMGIFFKSIVVPIRSVFSISLTLAWVYGLTVLVYVPSTCDRTRLHLRPSTFATEHIRDKPGRGGGSGGLPPTTPGAKLPASAAGGRAPLPPQPRSPLRSPSCPLPPLADALLGSAARFRRSRPR